MATFYQQNPKTPTSIMLRSRYDISQKEANRLRDQLRKKGYTPRQIRELDIKSEDIPEAYRTNKPAQDYRSIQEAQSNKRVEVAEGYGSKVVSPQEIREYELQRASAQGQTLTLQQRQETTKYLEATKTPTAKESETDRINRELGEAGIKNASDFFKASREGSLEIKENEGKRQITITKKETKTERTNPDTKYFTFTTPTTDNPSGTITGRSTTINQSDINKFTGSLEIKDYGAKGSNAINAQYLYNLPTRPTSTYYPNVYEQTAFKIEEAGERNPEYKFFTDKASFIFKNVLSTGTETIKPITEPIIDPIVKSIKNPKNINTYYKEEIKGIGTAGGMLVMGTIDFLKNPTPVAQDIINVAQAPFYNEYPKGFQSLTRLGTQYAIAKGTGVVLKGGLKVWDKYSNKWVEPTIFTERPTSNTIWESEGKIASFVPEEYTLEFGTKYPKMYSKITAPELQTRLRSTGGEAFGYTPELDTALKPNPTMQPMNYFEFIKTATPEQIRYLNEQNAQTYFQTSGKQMSTFLFNKEKIALEQARSEGAGEQTKLASKTESGKEVLLYGGQIYGSLYLEGVKIGGELYRGINEYWKSIPDEPTIKAPAESPELKIKLGNPLLFVAENNQRGINPPIIRYETPSTLKETNIYTNKVIDITRSKNKAGTTTITEPTIFTDTSSRSGSRSRTITEQTPSQEQEQPTETIPTTTTTNTTIGRGYGARAISPFKTEPLKPIWKIQEEKRKTGMMGIGFNVFERKRGMLQQINPYSLSKTQAINYGAYKVGSTSTATFIIKPSGKSPRSISTPGADLSQFKRKENIYTELNKFRINTPGELQEITFKGIATPKKKKNRRMNIWGLPTL